MLKNTFFLEAGIFIILLSSFYRSDKHLRHAVEEGLKDLFKARALVGELGLEPGSFWLQCVYCFYQGSRCLLAPITFPSVPNSLFSVYSPKLVPCTFASLRTLRQKSPWASLGKSPAGYKSDGPGRWFPGRAVGWVSGPLGE